ncbi:MAG: prephenate dehydrogenase/arogenate dehydrogenase family protein [Burkholderiales bacterium]|nr:prephenate dehydrogenase/arogenate dehydrogenase family protein [Burkholderiales bacterium]
MSAPAGPPQGRAAPSGGGERSSLRGEISKLVVVGVGLIGGSCALALRRAGAVDEIVGVGRTRANLDTARERGIVDRALTLDGDWAREAADADVVLVAAPVAQFPSLFAALAPRVGAETVVTDAGSTKQDVIAAARNALGPKFAAFVPGHPIAGTEHTGAAAAFPALFDHRSVILTPLPETAAQGVERVAAMWRLCGARVGTLAPDRHDAIFAAVSHLPHVLAFALVAELAARPDAAAYFDHAASGFRDFTRIAGSSPEMWRDIALANRDALLAEIDGYGEALKATRALIAAGEARALGALFAQASTARRAWEARRTQPVVQDK